MSVKDELEIKALIHKDTPRFVRRLVIVLNAELSIYINAYINILGNSPNLNIGL